MVHHTPLRRELRTVPSRQTLQKSAELQSHFPRGWSTCGIPCLSSESHVNMDEGLEWLEAGPLLLTLREPQLQRNACPASKKDSSSGTFKPRDERTPKKNPPRPGLASALIDQAFGNADVSSANHGLAAAAAFYGGRAAETKTTATTGEAGPGPVPGLSGSNLCAIAQPHARGPAALDEDLLDVCLAALPQQNPSLRHPVIRCLGQHLSRRTRLLDAIHERLNIDLMPSILQQTEDNGNQVNH